MNIYVFLSILVVSLLTIILVINFLSNGSIEDITWEEGDKPEEVVSPPKRLQEVEKVVNTKEKEDYDHGIAFIALVLLILGTLSR